MKLQKFFLGTAALGLTVASGFAFKMHKKFNLTQLHTHTTSSCRLSSPACYTLSSSSSQVSPCNFITYYTSINHTACASGSTWATSISKRQSLITTNS
jgi:hypothetical protein